MLDIPAHLQLRVVSQWLMTTHGAHTTTPRTSMSRDIQCIGWLRVYVEYHTNRFYDVEIGYNPDDFVPPSFCQWIYVWTIYVYLLHIEYTTTVGFSHSLATTVICNIVKAVNTLQFRIIIASATPTSVHAPIRDEQRVRAWSWNKPRVDASHNEVSYRGDRLVCSTSECTRAWAMQ